LGPRCWKPSTPSLGFERRSGRAERELPTRTAVQLNAVIYSSSSTAQTSLSNEALSGGPEGAKFIAETARITLHTAHTEEGNLGNASAI